MAYFVSFIPIRPVSHPHVFPNPRSYKTRRTFPFPSATELFILRPAIPHMQSSSLKHRSSEKYDKPSIIQGTKHLSTNVVVVPGKFDSFHIGHRHLAEVAAQNGIPTLVSFSGMASALGWKPRPPVVADVERDRILRAWSVDIGVPVVWRVLPFQRVREMSPQCFLQFIINQFEASGIVCGIDWRFGRGRAGDVSLLKSLAPAYNLQVTTARPVDLDGTVSSTRVRAALQAADVQLVTSLLGRYHRVVGYTLRVESEGVICGNFVNMVPACETYEVIVRVIGRVEPFRTTASVIIEDSEPLICVRDADRVYCKDCEIYIDFVTRKI